MKKLKVVYIYFLFLFLICLGYFIENSIKNTGIYEKIDEYFGITIFPALLFLICYGLLFFLPKNFKRFILEIKLYSLLISIILLIYIYILFNSDLNLSLKNIKDIESINLNNENLKSLIDISLNRYKIGYLPTYIFWVILSIKVSFKKLFVGLSITPIILILFIIVGPIVAYIKRTYLERKERKRLEREERLLYEQIKIKESLERNETIKKVKFRENREKILEEKVEVFKKNIELKKMVNLNEENKVQKKIKEKEVENLVQSTKLQKFVNLDLDAGDKK